MKRLLFEELAIVSEIERSATRVRFDRESTVIRGDNDTGKSSILKSLYWTLGAEVPSMKEWKRIGVTSSLTFTVDGVKFRMLRKGTSFTLFDANDDPIGVYSSVTHELAPRLAALFDFRLLLTSNADLRDIQATPAFLFLPFYIDQDEGWSTKLASFGRLKQFSRPIKDAVDFHFGIRPPGFYLAKSRYTDARAQASPLKAEADVLRGVVKRLEVRLEEASFDLDLESFRAQVDDLLSRCERLQQDENEQKARMSAAYAAISSAEQQIAITENALRELRADREFAAALEGDSVECPTCHARYDNGFAERFAIAIDEDACLSLIESLNEELRVSKSRYEEAQTASRDAQENAEQLRRLLASKQEQVALSDVLRSESRKEAKSVLAEQIREIQERIAEFLLEADSAKADMDSYDDKARKKEIIAFFSQQMARLLDLLDIYGSNRDAYLKPDAKLNESGSDQPRAILAFFYAALGTIAKYSECTFCPIVIDSPKQQDQDAKSWRKICEVIDEWRPEGSQLILAYADDPGVDFRGKSIELTRKRRVLSTKLYDSVSAELMPLIEAALDYEGEDLAD